MNFDDVALSGSHLLGFLVVLRSTSRWPYGMAIISEELLPQNEREDNDCRCFTKWEVNLRSRWWLRQSRQCSNRCV